MEIEGGGEWRQGGGEGGVGDGARESRFFLLRIQIKKKKFRWGRGKWGGGCYSK